MIIENSGYEKALQAVVDMRMQRKSKYGDSWRERKEYQLMGAVKEKADRLEFNFLNPSEDYEGKVDCLVDLVNWALFYLETEIEKKEQIKPEVIPF